MNLIFNEYVSNSREWLVRYTQWELQNLGDSDSRISVDKYILEAFRSTIIEIQITRWEEVIVFERLGKGFEIEGKDPL